jgi:hypothetical protein
VTFNLQGTITEKQEEYQELAFENEQQGQQTKITVVRLILSAMAAIHIMLHQSFTAPILPPSLLCQVQRNVLFLRQKFLNDKDHLPDEEDEKPKSCHFAMFPPYTHFNIS